MNTRISLTVFISALSLTAVSVRGEPTAASAPPPRSGAEAIRISEKDAPSLEADQLTRTLRDLAETKAKVFVAQNDSQKVIDSMKSFYAPTRRGPGPARALVIRSSDSDPVTQANLEEDQAVMTHILDKAVDEAVGDSSHGRTAMGINVMFAPGSNPVRSLYLEGYGTLFMLRVNFPLLAPPKVKEEPKEKPASDSSWEEARRELYGQTGETKVAVGPAEEFDADKVNQLKDALTEALKSAANIRGLKADDWITVCVFGSSAAPGKERTPRMISARKGEDAKSPPDVMGNSGRTLPTRTLRWGTSEGGPRRGTVMTIRVKKSDVDAFAKGKLDLDEFRRKAGLTVYQGGGSDNDGFADAVGNFNTFLYQYEH